MHRQFSRKLSQNRFYIQTHCNDRKFPFQIACRKWYLYNNPQGCYTKNTPTSKTNKNSIILIFVQIKIISVTFFENSIFN